MTLRWAQGQGQNHHGTRWHLIVEDRSRSGGLEQLTACGRWIVQSTDLSLDHYDMDYLVRYHADEYGAWAVCPKCWRLAPPEARTNPMTRQIVA